MLVRSENRWLYRDVTRQTQNYSVWSAFELMLPLWWWPAHLSRDNLGGSATSLISLRDLQPISAKGFVNRFYLVLQNSKIQPVAEPPKLSRLKCADHHHKGNISSNALQTEQFLVCRVTSRYNHRFSDRKAYPARRRVQRYYNHNFTTHA